MTRETEVTPADEPVMVARDREDDTPEVKEQFELEKPETGHNRDYEDKLNDDDPRAHIYARHNEKREEEIAENQDAEETVVENNEPVDIIPGNDQGAATPPDAEEMVEIVVLGDVRRVSKKKVDDAGGAENYQIRIAAYEQMERNAHDRKAIVQRQAALDERERRMAENQPVIPATDSQEGQPPDDLPSDGQNLEAMARQYQEAVYDGDENAPSILAQMVAKAAASGEKFDKDAFRKQVKDELIEDQRKAKVVKAATALIDSHPELNKRDKSFDPRMFNAVNSETNVVRRQHPNWEPEEQIQEAYDRVRKWKGDKPASTMNEKQDAKRAVNRPRASSQRHAPPPPAPRPTNSDYVANLRKERGQEL